MGNTLALVMDYKGMQAQKAAAESEMQQAELAGKMEALSTQQDVVDRTKQLYAQLAAVNTQFSSSGLTGSGASKANFERMERDMSASDIAARKTMGLAKRRTYRLQGFNAKMDKKAATYAFYGKAGKYMAGQGGDSGNFNPNKSKSGQGSKFNWWTA
tara:strand:+ start:1741 stop:2211 length:471 start_codon:yes stop_codon:yes gene_type:complete